MRATIFDGSTTAPLTAAEARTRDASGPFVWIDITVSSTDDPDAAELLAALGHDDFEVAQAMRRDVAGTLLEYHGVLIGVTWLGGSEKEPTPEVHFSWDPTRLVTLRFGGDADMDWVRQRIAGRATSLFAEPRSVPGVVLQLFLATVNRRLTELRSRLDAINESIIEWPRQSQLGDLREVRTAAAPMTRRFPVYADAVAAALVDPSTLPGMDAVGARHLQTYGTQVQDTVQRISDLADGLRSAVQDYQAEVGNRQGNRINQLTIVSIIFLPITFLTGYFGMNFQWMEDEITSFLAWLLLGALLPVLMLVASVAVLAQRGYRLSLSRVTPPQQHPVFPATPGTDTGKDSP